VREQNGRELNCTTIRRNIVCLTSTASARAFFSVSIFSSPCPIYCFSCCGFLRGATTDGTPGFLVLAHALLSHSLKSDYIPPTIFLSPNVYLSNRSCLFASCPCPLRYLCIQKQRFMNLKIRSINCLNIIQTYCLAAANVISRGKTISLQKISNMSSARAWREDLNVELVGLFEAGGGCRAPACVRTAG
jgi:hypothetical protein